MGGPETRGRSIGLRACGCAAAGLLLLGGCTSGEGTEEGKAAGRTTAASPTPPTPAAVAPSPTGTVLSLVPALDESKQPRTPAEAHELLARIVIAEDALGPDVVRSAPFESDPGRWPVLDADCVWQTEGLPPDVLATNTRYFHIPAANGHGRVRINTTVTVHRDRTESGWETARAMEEVLRCPDQKLREGEHLKGLLGNSVYQGEQGNNWSEDAFNELGTHTEAGGGEPQRYFWYQAQFGPVTVGVAGKNAAGYAEDALMTLVVQGNSRMISQAKQALGKAAG
ncbi:hypothetical protein [Streptomyces sp. NPDC091027]|uniref:hypothetical protein n=1 Tax=Streptomyces sp. NPDC091027 TaxID=3365971 RepID=UPI0037F30DF9